MSLRKKFLFYGYTSIFLIFIFLANFNIALAVEEPDLSYFDIDFSDGCIYSEQTAEEDRVCKIPWIGQYIAAIYRYGIGLAGILAVVAVMVGGFIWLSSAGSSERIKTAEGIIMNALAGLTLALFSYVILQTINPRLVALDPLQIRSIKSEEPAEVVAGANFCCLANGSRVGLNAEGQCSSGQECGSSQHCGCTAWAPSGGVGGQDTCLSYECQNPSVGAVAGSSCLQDGNCASGLICLDKQAIGSGTCGPAGSLLPGAHCERNEECQSGLCDFAGVNECALNNQ